MLNILNEEYKLIHLSGGNPGIGPGCKLVIMLVYYREYRAMRQLSFEYDISVSTVCDSIKWVENILIKNEKFIIKGIDVELEKEQLSGNNVTSIIGDVEEQPIERPKKNQEVYYSGKKKMHTMKNQIIIDEKSGKIINFYIENGTVHDFQILKNSKIVDALNDKKISGKFDLGYLGIKNIMNDVSIPIKKSKLHELTNDEKEYNHRLSSKRIAVEHTNRKIKIFRIAKEKYRNHLNRYNVKMQIICSLYNLNLE